jgi:hypothetical protein
MQKTSIMKEKTMVEVTGIDDDGKKKNKRGGIKSFTFTATGKNGEAHRKNAVKKHRQHLANVVTRAALYQERMKIGAAQWHAALTALSQGTA